MNRTDSPRQLLLVIAGFLIWSSAFTALYAANAIGCSLGWQNVEVGAASLNKLVLLVVWAGHLAASGVLLRGCLKMRRSRADQGQLSRFMSASTLGAAGVALFATLWTGLPIVGASTCV